MIDDQARTFVHREDDVGSRAVGTQSRIAVDSGALKSEVGVAHLNGVAIDRHLRQEEWKTGLKPERAGQRGLVDRSIAGDPHRADRRTDILVDCDADRHRDLGGPGAGGRRFDGGFGSCRGEAAAAIKVLDRGQIRVEGRGGERLAGAHPESGRELLERDRLIAGNLHARNTVQ